MPNKIERRSSVSSPYVLTASASTTPIMPYGAVSGAIIVVSAVSGGATSLTWRVSTGAEVASVPLVGASATTIAAGNAYEVPDEVFAAPFITATTNAGTATITLLVKG
jgi:hypothetical protein